MQHYSRICRWFSIFFLCIPLLGFASTPVKSIVIFGDSYSDIGNTTHLLKSLRQEESPGFLVAPLRIFVVNRMIEFANDYYVPQMVLDAGIDAVTTFFNTELGPFLANLVNKVKLVPLLPAEPYWKSRFSNGRVWNEYLAEMLSLQKDDVDLYLNKAFGGSWATTYDQQLTVWNLIRHPIGTIKTLIVGKLIPPSLGLTVQAYLLEHEKLNAQTVYFIFSGTNDYLNILQFEDNYNPAVMTVYIDNVLDGLSSSILKLVKAGGSHFVIMGIPHIGNIPKYVKTLDSAILNDASDQHNTRLQTRIAEWKKLYPKVDFLFINTNQYLAQALTNSVKYGFTNVTEPCIDVKFPMLGAFANSPFANNYVLQYAQKVQYSDAQFATGDTNYQVCDAPEHYLFWDDVHPSTRVHSYLGSEVCNEMKAHGYAVKCQKPSLLP